MTDKAGGEGIGPRSDRSDGRADPRNHAALLLAESLIHGLVAKSVLTHMEAIEIIDIALEVMSAMADDEAMEPLAIASSVASLNRMSASLRHEMGE